MKRRAKIYTALVGIAFLAALLFSYVGFDLNRNEEFCEYVPRPESVPLEDWDADQCDIRWGHLWTAFGTAWGYLAIILAGCFAAIDAVIWLVKKREATRGN